MVAAGLSQNGRKIMADESTNGGVNQAQGPGGQMVEPTLQLIGQYVRDLSFENPGLGMQVQRPQIDLSVDLQARRANEANQYEVMLKLRVTASDNSKPMFLLELAYGGMFLLSNVPEDSIQPILLIECPRLIFPFARRIVADVVRDGGLPPLMIEPIDFVALYRSKMQEAAGTRVS
jgi:preprotein translocase subunit SecB